MTTATPTKRRTRKAPEAEQVTEGVPANDQPKKPARKKAVTSSAKKAKPEATPVADVVPVVDGPSAEEIRSLIVTSLDKDKAQDIVVIDLEGKSSLADCMVVASGTSGRQVAAMAEHLVEKLKAKGVVPRAEGLARADWVLIDAYDVIVHLFRPEVREFYGLEKMWQAEIAEEGFSSSRR